MSLGSPLMLDTNLSPLSAFYKTDFDVGGSYSRPLFETRALYDLIPVLSS
jgi:hypothetical protein